jgi:hypothetical protein
MGRFRLAVHLLSRHLPAAVHFQGHQECTSLLAQPWFLFLPLVAGIHPCLHALGWSPGSLTQPLSVAAGSLKPCTAVQVLARPTRIYPPPPPHTHTHTACELGRSPRSPYPATPMTTPHEQQLTRNQLEVAGAGSSSQWSYLFLCIQHLTAFHSCRLLEEYSQEPDPSTANW